MNRGILNQLCNEDKEDLLKKLLHQQGKCLLIYPQGSHTSLLTALAETIHTNDETLHQKLSERLQQDFKDQTLPRRLGYIYEDPSIVSDFKKHPELVNFVKIILELFSASTERRIKVYFLTYSGEIVYNLSCKIINDGSYSEEISIAKIQNKYYNIQDLELSSKQELSLDDVFKSSPHIDTEELIETFKPEIKQNMIVRDKDSKDQLIVEETRSSGRPSEDFEEPDLVLKRAKSSLPFQHEQKPYFHSDTIGSETLSLREQNQLINQCGQNQQNFETYPNLGVMSQQQLYYYYYQNSYYPKNDNYINYPGMQMNSMSPSKSALMKNPSNTTNSVTNTSSNYNQNNQGSPISDEGENKRYTGRLKFFDEGKNYGFIIMDSDESDIFVHYDDLQKAGITKQVIKSFKNQMYLQIRFNFKVMEYFGKYKKSRKAVELVIIEDELSLLGNNYPIPK